MDEAAKESISAALSRLEEDRERDAKPEKHYVSDEAYDDLLSFLDEHAGE
jgi:hypothetical protein